MFPRGYCTFISLLWILFLLINVSQQSALYGSESNDLKQQADTIFKDDDFKSLRKRRGLLDLSLDVQPVLGLLNTGNRKDPTTPTVPSTDRNPLPGRKPAVSNRVMNGPKCGQRIVQHTELITSGLSTKPGDWPWHAALYRIKSTGSHPKYICGGTLLSKTRVLTAGHCVLENSAIILPERLFVTLGKYNLAGGDLDSQEKSVFDIMVHPDFIKTTLANDIAILKLSSRVTYTDYVQPICLWDTSNKDKSFITNKIGTVVGWGYTEQDVISSQLMQTTMPVATDLDCIKSKPQFYSKFLTDSTFCAGYRNGSSVCNGDSGGGMFFSEKGDNGQDIWLLRGIVSLSVSHAEKSVCDPNEYTIFTDAAQYNDFIQNNL